MKKILYFVNVDSFFISHRLPIATTAIERGFEVYLLTRITSQKDFLESLGIKVINIDIDRSKINLFKEVSIFFRVFNCLRRIKPDIFHLVTIKPVIYGGILGRLLKTKAVICAVSGLGYVFLDRGLKALLRKKIVLNLYKTIFNNKRCSVILQNNDDIDFLLKSKVLSKGKVVLIKGSGVDLNIFQYSREEQDKINVLFIGRLLRDKGIYEFVEAVKQVKKSKPDIKITVAGDIDIENPSSVTENQLIQWKKEGFAEFIGFQNKMENIIKGSNIVVLPSYREGLPKALIEAAAVGRAIITTDVPGCRETIIDKFSGLLVPIKDVNTLYRAIIELIENDNLRKEFGKNGRALAEKEFDINIIIKKHFQLYESLIGK